MEDVFEMQDQITEQVVSTLEPQLRRAEIERARRKHPGNLDAYDLYLRALPHAYAMRPADNATALELLEEAMRLDPAYVPAAAFAAWCYEQRITRGWHGAGDHEAREAVRLARFALAADTEDANIISIAGFVLLMVGRDYGAGMAALASAVELNPYNPFVLMNHGWANVFAGDLDVALASLERARRLSRRDPAAFFVLTGLAMTHLLAGRCEAAVELAEASLAVYEDWFATHLVHALALECVGRVDEAEASSARLMSFEPALTISDYRQALPFRDPERIALLERHMKAVGIPE